MRNTPAGLLAGLIGGAVMALAMTEGRRHGLLHKTLAENSEDWLDRNFATRRRLGDQGNMALEQANHMASAAAFGAAYAMARPAFRSVPTLLGGALYGVGLYAVNIVGIAPLLGITEGERAAPRKVAAQRLGMHLLFGIVTALAADALATGTRAAGDGPPPRYS